MKTYRFIKAQLQAAGFENIHSESSRDDNRNDEEAGLLEDEALINQYKERGPIAILENIRDYGPGESRDRLWAGTYLSDGSLSLVREGMHNLFEGTDIAQTQKWCVD